MSCLIFEASEALHWLPRAVCLPSITSHYLPAPAPIPSGCSYHTQNNASILSFALALPLAWNALPMLLHIFRACPHTLPPFTPFLFNEMFPELCSNPFSADQRVVLVAGSLSHRDATFLDGGLPEKIGIGVKDSGIPYGILHPTCFIKICIKFGELKELGANGLETPEGTPPHRAAIGLGEEGKGSQGGVPRVVVSPQGLV